MLLSLENLCVLLVATLIARMFIHVWTYRRYYYLGYLIPGPHGSFGQKARRYLNFIGSLDKALDNVSSMIEKTRDTPVFKVWIGLELMVFIVDPDLINKFYQDNLRKSDMYKLLSPYTAGKSILDQNNIPAWKERRHMLQAKSFSFGALEYYNRIFNEESKILADKMEPLAKSGIAFEPFQLVTKANLATVVRTLCGLDLQIQQDVQGHYEAILKAYANMFKTFILQCIKPWFQIGLIFYLFGLKAQESYHLKMAQSFLENLFEKIREKLKENGFSSNHILNKDRIDHDYHERDSFAETIIKAEMDPSIPQDQVISQKDLGNELLFLIGEGFDTTKMANSLLLVILAIYPDVQTNVYEEIINVLGEDLSIIPTNSQLNQLHLLTRVIKETLRLFPPAPIVGRRADRDIQAGDYTLPKGSSLAVVIPGIHRDPRHWPNPHQFDPDRFLPSEVAKRNPNAYMPFSTGPRNCIAHKYAMLNMKMTMSTILRRYRLLSGDKCKCLEDIGFQIGISMVALPGNDIRIEKRNP